jgi:type IV pilus assembly protein PilF
MMPGGRAISLLTILLVAVACTTSGSKPGNPHIAAEDNAQLGLAYMEQGNDELAMQKLQHALELDAKSANAHHYIAQLYMKLGKNSEAEEHYRKALSLTPSNPMLLNNYGVFLCRQQRLDEAREKFLSAAKQPFYKTPEEAYNNAGVCALKAADTAKAEEYFRDALRANPNMPEALYELADLKFKQQDYLHARAFLQRYLEVAPVSPAILWLGVRVERKLGDVISVAKYAKQLQEKFPTSREAELLQRQQAP